MANDKKVKMYFDYFDDCFICQSMKEAEEQGKSLGMKELETVFAKQDLKNKLNKNNKQM